MEIIKLPESLETEYEEFLQRVDGSMIYHTLRYRNMLQEFLGDEAHYLVALDTRGHIHGALPCFIKKGAWGENVLNSLPFYGSNGSIVADDKEVRHGLLERYKAFIKEQGCCAATIITTPFERDNDGYAQYLQPSFVDSRIGQVTFLPECVKGEPEQVTEEKLFKMMHYKTRNAVRKAFKQGIEVTSCADRADFTFLVEEHKRNMEKIGGLAKPSEFFTALQNNFREGVDYRIYVAKHEGVRAAALLLLYYKDTVEYFTPVISEEYREYQPMSALIMTAMKEAVGKGFKKWNWGGTWRTQDGVYRFKSRWGTTDLNYYYFTSIENEAVLHKEKEQILEQYPYYYVFPFHGGIDYFGQEEPS